MNEPIRILHCVVKLGRGGAETLIMNIYRNIKREQIQFDFLTSIDGDYEEEIKNLGGRIYKIPYITEVGPIKYSKQVYNFFKQHGEYKIVHSHMDRMSGLIMREAKRANVPVRIAHSHSTQCSGGFAVRLIKKYYSGYLGNASCYFACSEAAAEFMFKDSNIKILKNGIECEKFIYNAGLRKKLREQLNCQNKFVIGHVGRFSEPKNHDFLIDIFNGIHEKYHDSELVLIGQGSLQKKIEKKVKSLGLDDCVHFMGSCSNVNEWLNTFDVFLFPSLYEGLGIAAVEAQANGLKCVLSTGVPQVVDISGNIEFLSLRESVEKWAEKVLEFKSGYERRDMQESINNAGYDIRLTAKYLEEFYRNEYAKLS